MTNDVAGIVLAGGLSRRMGGGDKCLRDLGGKPILAHILERASPQVGKLALNVNGDAARFAAFGLPCVPDSVEGFAGPLAGVLAGLDWAAEHAPEAKWVASFAGDAPFLPADLVARMLDAVAHEGADMASVSSAGQTHPVFGLWPVSLREQLRQALTVEKIFKVDRWTARYRTAIADFPIDGIDPFFNANAPEDLAQALMHLGVAPPVAKDAKFRVGLFVRSSPPVTQWGETQWLPHSVVAGEADLDLWSKVREEGDTTIWFAGNHTIELFVAETVMYKMNLEQREPGIYAILRPDPALPAPGIAVKHVTASPGEAEALSVDGTHVVARVALPDSIGALLAGYVAAYHVEEVFKKRKRTEIDPRKGFGKGAGSNDYGASFAQKENRS
jgi:molybdenum cofactor guanylyltransferase